MENIPVVDLKQQHLDLNEELLDAFKNVLTESAFVRGKYVNSFEEMFAKLTGRKHCISCANGTDALYIAMNALKLKKNEEVIVPAHSWISTSETVTQAGGKVVFCDTNPDDFTINADLIESKINTQIERTRSEETSPKNTTLYFNFLIRTKDLITHKYELVEKYYGVVKKL